MVNMFEEAMPAIKHFYDKPERKYHNVAHIKQVFDSLEQVAGITDWERNARLGLLVIMHDAYYDPLYNLNEFESACIAAELFPEYSNYLIQGILATRDHKLDNVSDQVKQEISLFLDADMSILAADEGEYIAYAENIKAEYLEAGVKLEDYSKGRLKFLKSFHGFLTPEYQKLNHKAFDNIDREILIHKMFLGTLGEEDE
jgi:predicted metal-dependent HD superfamily phosphohydrolase